jgi:hypothetical protein
MKNMIYAIVVVLGLIGLSRADLVLYEKSSGDFLSDEDGNSIVVRGAYEIGESSFISSRIKLRGVKWSILGIRAQDKIDPSHSNISDIPTSVEIIPLDVVEREAAKEAEAKAAVVAARLAVAPRVLASDLTENESLSVLALWPKWTAGRSVLVDELYQYDGGLYKVIQAHTTQASWTPPVAPALFAKVAVPGTIPAWSQPAGAHDVYQSGDQVTHNGSTWESDIDNNVWEPGVYGWTEQ